MAECREQRVPDSPQPDRLNRVRGFEIAHCEVLGTLTNQKNGKVKVPMSEKLMFTKETFSANFMDPSGEPLERLIESRKHPITFRTCRITLSRSQEKEAGTESMPAPPPNAADTSECPFCTPQLYKMTPCLDSKTFSAPRLKTGKSVLFPNLFPYGSYSAVSLIDENHFVEIGSASPVSN